MNLLLVGNYPPDRQESMLRFAGAMFSGLKDRGVNVELLQPQPRLANPDAAPVGKQKWLGYADKLLLFRKTLRAAANKADLVHILDHSNAHYLRQLCGKPCLQTCNDLLAIRSARGEFAGQRTRLTGKLLQQMILKSLPLASRFACISKATMEDLLRITSVPESAVRVVYMGLTHPYRPEPSETKPSPYILHVGGDTWYKNRQGVLQVYAQICTRLGSAAPGLVMVGPPMAGAPAQVRFLQGVSNSDLQKLYSDAALLLFPSLEEGFGWPIVEAQACGCPVLTTGKAPMTEAGGDAAVYLPDPGNITDCAEAVCRVLGMPEAQREQLRSAGIANAARFGLDRMLDGYLQIYSEMLETSPRRVLAK